MAIIPENLGMDSTPPIKVTVQSSHDNWWTTVTKTNIGAVKQTSAYNMALAESTGGKSGLALASIADNLVGGCAFVALPSGPVPYFRVDDGPLIVDARMRAEITEGIFRTIARLNPGFVCPGILVKDSLGQINPETLRALRLHTYVNCTFRVNLRKPEDELWRSLTSTARLGVKKAARQGYNIVTDVKGEFLEDFSRILKESLERGGDQYYHDSLLAAIRKHMIRTGLARIYLASIGNDIAAGALILCDPGKQRLYYYLAGSSLKHRGTGGDLLTWEIIKDGALEEYSHLDMEGVSCSPQPGTKDEGIFKFKSKWGGTLYQTYYHANLAYFLLWMKLTKLPGTSHLIRTAVRIRKMMSAKKG